jgi:sec-independent protein translocase protein TatC
MKRSLKSFMPHVQELKKRFLKILAFFFISFVFCFSYADWLFKILAYPLEVVLARHHFLQEWLYTNLAGVLTSYVDIAFFGALCLTVPYTKWQMWQFIAPGLLKGEKSFCRLLFLMAPLLFFLGGFFCYYYVMPKTWEFFIAFGESSTLTLRLFPMMDQYLALSMKFILAFGLCFQLPLLMVLLAHLGLGTADSFGRIRRFVIVGIFIVAALLTPPDVLSQILLALPLWGLYEVSIILIKLKEKKSNHARH